MTALAPRPPDALARLRDLDTSALRAELAHALKLTANHLLYLAAVWSELERRGEDLSNLRVGFAGWLPAIAAGTVAPEVVVAFAGQPRKLRAIAKLPVAEQEKIARGELPPPPVCRSWVGKDRNPARPRREVIQEDDPVPGKSLLEQMAAKGSARDVADMLMQVVRAAENPRDVAQRLQAELAALIATVPKRRLT